MQDNFVRLMMFPREAKNAREFLGDVLTPTEQQMIAKRLAVIVMLCRGYSGYKIRAALKVSPSTTTRFSAQLENGMFPYLEHLFRGTRSVRREKEADDFWDALYKVVLMGMPPRVGRGRWKFLFEDRN
ncbi:MAG: hypothetical protein G01um101417_639 [Parcubacteria group bacterium Gr01-1014_17]|nr:MAG: hypothetical protein G01um101417_639 [Parcubacteria group bacterium Gr01-1014_17]